MSKGLEGCKACETCGDYLEWETILVARKWICTSGIIFTGVCIQDGRIYWHPVGTIRVMGEQDDISKDENDGSNSEECRG